ncbi:hypothetical protein AB1L30_20065 [Bremerella sp. JC817]|uniref:hypothetical protein n=1 Tax=Bremerella sp. JC817 TaxID=3231756 RepID=UPI003459C60D
MAVVLHLIAGILAVLYANGIINDLLQIHHEPPQYGSTSAKKILFPLLVGVILAAQVLGTVGVFRLCYCWDNDGGPVIMALLVLIPILSVPVLSYALVRSYFAARRALADAAAEKMSP